MLEKSIEYTEELKQAEEDDSTKFPIIKYVLMLSCLIMIILIAVLKGNKNFKSILKVKMYFINK